MNPKKKAVEAAAPNGAYQSLVGGVASVIEDARRTVALSVNAAMTAAYWLVGRYIVEFEQGGQERAGYGSALLQRSATDLTHQFGRGFSRPNLQQMRLFYLAYPPQQICQTPSSKSEQPPQSPIGQTPSGKSLARYALEGLPNKVMAAEYRTALPDEAVLVAEIDRARDELNARDGHLAAKPEECK